MKKEFDKVGVESKLIILNNEPHGFDEDMNKDILGSVFSSVIDFMDKHTMGGRIYS